MTFSLQSEILAIVLDTYVFNLDYLSQLFRRLTDEEYLPILADELSKFSFRSLPEVIVTSCILLPLNLVTLGHRLDIRIFDRNKDLQDSLMILSQ